MAVLAVIAYHYAPGKVSGGFIGVDIFFVISGYLITSIIHGAFIKQQFSLLNFYIRRIKRIFPALILILLFCFTIGWLFMFPSELKALGKHIAAGSGFIQNIVLWRESGYFDVSAIEKPLLHLWSLAVEEQFYILWPLCLWFLIKTRIPLLQAIGVISLITFAINIWGIWSGHQVATFYLPISRAWELTAGAWLAVAHKENLNLLNKYKNAQAIIGLMLILLGIVLVKPDSYFPGFWALLPVIGTALIINCGPGSFINNKLFSLKPAVWVGLISYPLYLWHWVLWSMVVIIIGENDLPTLRKYKVVAIVLTFILSWITYKFFEQPIRYKYKNKAAATLLLIIALCGFTGLYIYKSDGMPNRAYSLVNPNAEAILDTAVRSNKLETCADLHNKDTSKWYCILGDDDAKKLIIAYGDSHAMSMIPALDKYGIKHNARILFAGNSGCFSGFGVHSERENKESEYACKSMVNRIMDSIDSENPDAIVLIQRWTYYLGHAKTRPDEGNNVIFIDKRPATSTEATIYGLRKTTAVYQQRNIPVIILRDNPQQAANLPKSGLRFNKNLQDANSLNDTAVSYAEHLEDQLFSNQVLDSIENEFSNVSTLNIDSALCNDDICPWADDNKLLYYDDDHLSITGSLKVYPLLEQHLNQILKLSMNEVNSVIK